MKILDCSQLFVADAPIKKKENFVLPPLRMLCFGSVKSPMHYRVNIRRIKTVNCQCAQIMTTSSGWEI